MCLPPLRWQWLPLTGLLLSSSVTAAPTLLADVDGGRAALAARGLQFSLGYTSEDAANLSGGTRHTATHVGQLSLGTQLDLERLFGWSGMRGEVGLSHRDGDNLNERAGLGQLLQGQEAHGRGKQWRLGSLWLGKQWGDGRHGVKIGRLAVGDDFNALDCTAMGLSFCGSQPAMIVGDYWFNGPLSQWGAVLSYAPRDDLYIRASAYQVNPRYANERSGGLRLAPAGTVGTLTPVELGWHGKIGGRQGRYALGGWYSSAPRADAWRDIDGRAWADSGLDAAMRSGAYGAWLSAGQQLSRGNGSSDQAGWRVQMDLVRTDRRTGSIDATSHVIATYTGIGSTRAQDQIGLGVAATEVNPRYRQAGDGQRSAGRVEYSAEAYYRWQLLPGAVLQPALQYVVHPGGVSARPDVIVVGLKTQLAF